MNENAGVPHEGGREKNKLLLPRRVDLVVTELVDSGLLGEHILPVLRHARANLLKPTGEVRK